MANETLSLRVSVIIPVRDGRAYIDEAIASVLSQSFQDVEIVVINDGSTDGDYDALCATDPRIRVLHLAGNGVSTARNLGMQVARGELIAFLDADDVWFPGKLAAQVRYMEAHPEVGVVFGGFLKWEADPGGAFAPAASLMTDCSSLDRAEASRSGWLYTRLLMGLLVGMNTAMVRRSVVQAIGGFNVSMRQAEDYDFWLKASRIAEMHALDGPVALYRIHKASAMHRLAPGNALTTLLHAARLRWGLRGPNGDSVSEAAFERRLAQIHFDHGYAHFWDGSRSVARHSFYRAMRARYRPWRSAAYVALCSLPDMVKRRLQ
ncbi:glycosyltransferase [Hydrogenophaga sp.]|uniref:glycosyltransferase family 2 protein n=1 Tax=Hydrogenophaga sp. TaxID=1904254 RepID=UPI002731D4B4|nr:glycosyltransferase [Hydrogenophaga sp.]MDP2073785.1 glycosyltransferase [Hydrogenophaga sp.]MDP3106909.1 glycosyltransferase [Hydrogenophaga sp.]MDZ4397929.1 glycosyltransferase [Hydrogenophaga sp.]